MNSTADTVVLISDLDGTLLDTATYSSKAATEALTALKAEGISLVLSSSKTRAEMEPIRKRLAHEGPFIVENGGALFIPHGFFRHAPEGSTSREGYEIIEFGASYRSLRAAMKEIERVLKITIRGFGDMSVEEVSKLTGLAPGEAMLAQQRELLVMPLDPDDVLPLQPALPGERHRTQVGEATAVDRAAQLFEVQTERNGRTERWYEWVDAETGVAL